jgi:hypothetical protein
MMQSVVDIEHFSKTTSDSRTLAFLSVSTKYYPNITIKLMLKPWWLTSF